MSLTKPKNVIINRDGLENPFVQLWDYHKSGRFTTRLKKFALIVDLGQIKLTNFTVAIYSMY